MESIPVKRYRRPAYPTRLEVLSDPDLLAKHVPAAWLRRPELAGAVAVFLAANVCVEAGDKKPLPSVGAAVVAPIFEHGEGRGVTGCVVVAAPVFLSEEEALQVIVEVLGKAGVEVTARNVVMKDVVIPVRGIVEYEVAGKPAMAVREFPALGQPLSVDIEDGKRHIGVEFVSCRDYTRLGGVASLSTVQEYDFKQVAKGVAGAVREKGTGLYFGTFYDPVHHGDKEVVRPEDDRSRTVGAIGVLSESEARHLLRLQVQDFVDWLKGQGVL